MNSSDIARIAKVSRSTVSRVINNYSNVPEETRLKVQAVIDQYGYTPNTSARTLAGKTNNVIGVFLADICEDSSDSKWVGVTSPYNMEMLSYFIKIAKSKGYLTLVYTISDLKECQEMEGYFSTRMLHGGIFLGFPYHTKELEDMSKKGYNVVLIDQLADQDDKKNKVKRVNTDNVAGGFLATEHLIKNGHRKLLHVTGDDRLSSLERERGFIEACKKYNIKDYSIVKGLYRENVAYDEAKKFLEKNQVTGIFVANDIMCLGVFRACGELNLSIPEDISLVGFDHLQWSEWMTLELTSMDVSKESLAASAIDLLLADETRRLCVPSIAEHGTVRQISLP